ncbi:hypothetical protein BTO09_05810 [Gilvibacter sp. SZ-19]|nr:hypothetical protein BTO09_05810 [Gilvibacter sp. SZ-19]
MVKITVLGLCLLLPQSIAAQSPPPPTGPPPPGLPIDASSFVLLIFGLALGVFIAYRRKRLS